MPNTTEAVGSHPLGTAAVAASLNFCGHALDLQLSRELCSIRTVGDRIDRAEAFLAA